MMWESRYNKNTGPGQLHGRMEYKLLLGEIVSKHSIHTVVLMLVKLWRCITDEWFPSSTPTNSTNAPVIFVPQLFKSTATGLLLMRAK